MLFESLTRNSSYQHLLLLANKGFLDFLIDILKYEETYKLLTSGLDCLRNIFEIENYHSDGKNILTTRFLDQKGDILFERLQKNKVDLICKKVDAIIDNFFE